MIITLPWLESIDKLPFNVLKYLIESESIGFEHGYRLADRSRPASGVLAAWHYLKC